MFTSLISFLSSSFSLSFLLSFSFFLFFFSFSLFSSIPTAWIFQKREPQASSRAGAERPAAGVTPPGPPRPSDTPRPPQPWPVPEQRSTPRDLGAALRSASRQEDTPLCETTETGPEAKKIPQNLQVTKSPALTCGPTPQQEEIQTGLPRRGQRRWDGGGGTKTMCRTTWGKVWIAKITLKNNILKDKKTKDCSFWLSCSKAPGVAGHSSQTALHSLSGVIGWRFLICCLLNALNTNDSKLKHLNANLQCPAVHTYFKNIYLFKQRRKRI